MGRVMRGLFPSVLRIDVDGYDNRVWVGGPRGLNGRALRSAVAAHPVLRSSLEHLSFRKR